MICVCGEWIGKENEVVVEKEASASHVAIHLLRFSSTIIIYSAKKSTVITLNLTY